MQAFPLILITNDDSLRQKNRRILSTLKGIGEMLGEFKVNRPERETVGFLLLLPISWLAVFFISRYLEDHCLGPSFNDICSLASHVSY